jgi:hypothetical protein
MLFFLNDIFVSRELKSDLINDSLDLVTRFLQRTSNDLWNDDLTLSMVFLIIGLDF